MLRFVWEARRDGELFRAYTAVLDDNYVMLTGAVSAPMQTDTDASAFAMREFNRLRSMEKFAALNAILSLASKPVPEAPRSMDAEWKAFVAWAQRIAREIDSDANVAVPPGAAATEMQAIVKLGDCIELLRDLPDESIDSIVTDPPAGIGFMGADWDDFGRQIHGVVRSEDPEKGAKGILAGYSRGGRPDDRLKHAMRSREAFVDFLTAVMRECLRVLKPGGHAVVWALPRTSHWTATAIEDAGFEIRDVLHHVFGSGFPKSLNVSKAIDKAADAERKVIGPASHIHSRGTNTAFPKRPGERTVEESERVVAQNTPVLTAPTTDAARKWDGWGTALKPAVENWILARKPSAASTVAANVLAHGTGALNIDACRVGLAGIEEHRTAASGAIGTETGIYNSSSDPHNQKQLEREAAGLNPRYEPAGRWPANLVLSHVSPDENGESGCRHVGMRQVKTGRVVTFGDAGGTETVGAWECVLGCPVAELDRQSGERRVGKVEAHHVRTAARLGHGGVYGNDAGRDGVESGYGDVGGASRFFPTFAHDPEYDAPFLYCPKAGRHERDAGLEALEERLADPYTQHRGRRMEDQSRFDGEPPKQGRNTHPTVKSIALMRWLCRLVTPPGGLVLDPFAGSGSTGVAAIREGFHFIGFEKEPEYVEIAEARIAHALVGAPTPAEPYKQMESKMGKKKIEVEVVTCERCQNELSKTEQIASEANDVDTLKARALYIGALAVCDKPAPDEEPQLCKPCERSVLKFGSRIVTPKKKKVKRAGLNMNVASETAV